MYTIRLCYGDLSGDGHEKTRDILFQCNHVPEDIEKALVKGSELAGLDLFEKHFVDYEDSYLTQEKYQKLLSLGFQPTDVGDLVVYNDPTLVSFQFGENFKTLIFFLIKLGNPEIEINESVSVMDLDLSIGYGLLE